MKVAINGFGRIGRLVFRIMEEDPTFEVVAINDLTDAEQLAYLLKYDTNHRNYRVDEISYDESNIIVGERKIPVFSESDPVNLPWDELGVDEVFECTGHFTEKDKAMAHIEAGAKRVIISAPAKGDLKTIVYGVNEDTLDGSENVISAPQTRRLESHGSAQTQPLHGRSVARQIHGQEAADRRNRRGSARRGARHRRRLLRLGVRDPHGFGRYRQAGAQRQPDEDPRRRDRRSHPRSQSAQRGGRFRF